MLLDRVKALAHDRLLERVGDYVTDASPERMARMWGFFEKIASNPGDKREARRFRWLVENGHPFGEWLQRVGNELSPTAKKSLMRDGCAAR